MLTYLLESASNRIGGLDFQASPTEYVPRQGAATLADMLRAADRLQAGQGIPAELEPALLHGTSIGGARPKATLVDRGRELIAKFSSTTDPYPVVKAEAAALELARRVGLGVPASVLVSVLGRDVLLIERFDRTAVPGQRRLMVSALTVLGLTRDIADHQVAIIDRDWDQVAGAVGLSRAQSNRMRLGPGAQILNPFIHGIGSLPTRR